MSGTNKRKLEEATYDDYVCECEAPSKRVVSENELKRYTLRLINLLHSSTYKDITNNTKINTMQRCRNIHSSLSMNTVGVMKKMYSQYLRSGNIKHIVEIREDIIALIYKHKAVIFNTRLRTEVKDFKLKHLSDVIPITRNLFAISIEEEYYPKELRLYGIDTPTKFRTLKFGYVPLTDNVKVVDDNLVFGSVNDELMTLDVRKLNMESHSPNISYRCISEIEDLHYIEERKRVVTLNRCGFKYLWKGTLNLWDWETRKVIRKYELGGRSSSIIYIPTTSMYVVFVTCSKNEFLLFDEELTLLRRHETQNCLRLLSYCEPLGLIVSQDQDDRTFYLIDPKTFDIKYNIEDGVLGRRICEEHDHVEEYCDTVSDDIENYSEDYSIDSESYTETDTDSDQVSICDSDEDSEQGSVCDSDDEEEEEECSNNNQAIQEEVERDNNNNSNNEICISSNDERNVKVNNEDHSGCNSLESSLYGKSLMLSSGVFVNVFNGTINFWRFCNNNKL